MERVGSRHAWAPRVAVRRKEDPEGPRVRDVGGGRGRAEHWKQLTLVLGRVQKQAVIENFGKRLVMARPSRTGGRRVGRGRGRAQGRKKLHIVVLGRTSEQALAKFGKQADV